MIHELKTWPEYFQAVANNSKKFELRQDDRPYKVGDILHLREWSPKESDYTGRSMDARITYVLRNVEAFGLHEGFCLLSLA